MRRAADRLAAAEDGVLRGLREMPGQLRRGGYQRRDRSGQRRSTSRDPPGRSSGPASTGSRPPRDGSSCPSSATRPCPPTRSRTRSTSTSPPRRSSSSAPPGRRPARCATSAKEIDIFAAHRNAPVLIVDEGWTCRRPADGSSVAVRRASGRSPGSSAPPPATSSRTTRARAIDALADPLRRRAGRAGAVRRRRTTGLQDLERAATAAARVPGRRGRGTRCAGVLSPATPPCGSPRSSALLLRPRRFAAGTAPTGRRRPDRLLRSR